MKELEEIMKAIGEMKINEQVINKKYLSIDDMIKKLTSLKNSEKSNLNIFIYNESNEKYYVVKQVSLGDNGGDVWVALTMGKSIDPEDDVYP